MCHQNQDTCCSESFSPDSPSFQQPFMIWAISLSLILTEEESHVLGGTRSPSHLSPLVLPMDTRSSHNSMVSVFLLLPRIRGHMGTERNTVRFFRNFIATHPQTGSYREGVGVRNRGKVKREDCTGHELLGNMHESWSCRKEELELGNHGC